ncbi:hypothetical protein OPV22_015268 [Ensete ventricosum]|uniref:Pterin-binding domain-containing protein n=1 Tax=Ensete ventricosum TaxID=4639 RepID=A0AAV8R9Y0_ENSVE|nr:hypothetical protein OPV22_015268 [Ensete ventricosum]
MARSLLSPMPSSPQFSIYRRLALLPCRFPGISTSVHAHRPLLLLRAATQSPGPAGDDASSPSQEDAQKKNSKAAAPDLPSLPFLNIPIWARWLLGAAVILAVPFYRRILKIEGEVAKTVKAAVGVVEKVAEVTVEISKDVAEALPENTKLKQIALEVEEIAQVVDEEAKLAETILKEVDGVVEKVDTLVEPIVDELEGGEGEVTRQGKDSKTTI